MEATHAIIKHQYRVGTSVRIWTWTSRPSSANTVYKSAVLPLHYRGIEKKEMVAAVGIEPTQPKGICFTDSIASLAI